MNENGHRDGKFWAGFFLGGLLGAVTLFFLGTKDGKKAKKILQDKIEETAENITEKAVDKVDDTLSEIEDLTQKSLHTTEKLRKMFKNLPKKS